MRRADGQKGNPALVVGPCGRGSERATPKIFPLTHHRSLAQPLWVTRNRAHFWDPPWALGHLYAGFLAGQVSQKDLTFHGEYSTAKILEVDSPQVIGIQTLHKFFHLWGGKRICMKHPEHPRDPGRQGRREVRWRRAGVTN